MTPGSSSNLSDGKQQVVVAMSGGVDSSVAAALLIERGYDVIGIMMRLWSESPSGKSPAPNRCCTPDQMADARRVADHLEIPFYVLDVQDYFFENVVDYFIQAHWNGLTPNPCIQCNRHVRFEFLMAHAMALGADYLATGHYALVEKSSSRYHLLKAHDHDKDQSYVLHVLTQEQLAKVLFPIGEFTKQEVRALADRFGLPVANKDESMDLCFIADGDTKRFLKERAPSEFQPGPILSQDGAVLGQHDGLPFYTIGQRKGLGISVGKPVYINNKLIDQNALVVGTREQLGRDRLHANSTNWVTGSPPAQGAIVDVKIRYRARTTPAEVVRCTGDEIMVHFKEPVFGLTAGQGAVFYHDRECLGGGTITDKEER